MKEALNMFSHDSLRLDTVPALYSRTATWRVVNDMILLECGEYLVWWALETLGCQGLENTQRQMAFQNCDLGNNEGVEDSNGNLTSGGQHTGANNGRGKEPVRPDQCWVGNNNPFKDDDTRALEWLLICSRSEFARELVSPLSGI
jgi:hypothetical protein